MNHTIAGFAGLASKDWTLITNDEASGSLYTFDMRLKHPTPIPITVHPAHKIGRTDAIQLPRRYKGTVLLVAELGLGISVYRDKKGKWKEAEYLGMVEWTDQGTLSTAPLQVGDDIYLNLIPFADEGLEGPGTAGNRTDFLYLDVTKRVDELLKN